MHIVEHTFLIDELQFNIDENKIYELKLILQLYEYPFH